ncbi:uncharacterized mitochondrial protein AtMg00820-like [Benincasa hispida]|uniref:uncharacterized mitochondrial protein AtMg00820-like n=1 Tax=Benincasa hispida TaxID=102211 RepID=UPI0018FFE48E|nr:uncharacterized mitochondrial protein AtMg00820-like [Benincasa hispida]
MGIFKPKAWLSVVTDLDKTEPRSYKETLLHPRWKQAMLEGHEALIQNNTWPLTPLPQDHKVIGSKWVFRLKQTPSGEIARFKARLVAQGFSQDYGIDYFETSSPMVKLITIRLVFHYFISQLGHLIT